MVIYAATKIPLANLDDVDLWWLDQYRITFVVPAKENMTVTANALAQAAAGEEVTVGRRVRTVCHGQMPR